MKRNRSKTKNPDAPTTRELRERVSSQTNVVLEKVSALHSAMAETSTPPTPSVPSDALEARDMNSREVCASIVSLIERVTREAMTTGGCVLHVPSRAASNQAYIEELGRLVLRMRPVQRALHQPRSSRKTALTMRVLELVHELCRRSLHVTKRDLFYTDVKLFERQTESDDVLEDVACLLGSTRSSLNVVASEKGVVVGRVQFREAGDAIDCTRMGIGGKAIPPHLEQVTDLQSDAKFILLVEKDAAFMRLAEDRFYETYPCIIITAKGQPDVATRLFLRRVSLQLSLPVLGLVDSDPYGLKILSVYMSGSKNMSYDSASLTTPDVKWLGVRPTDLDTYHIPEQCRLKMSEHDIKTGKELLQEDFILKNPAWHAELKHMVARGEKAEIQALSSFGFQYLTKVYLPLKLQQGDWI